MNALPLRLAAVSLLFLARLSADVSGDTWSLQQRPGPDGYPHQDPATYPKSRTAFGTPQEKPERKGPALVEKSHGTWELANGWKLAFAIKVAGTGREISTNAFDTTAWYSATVPGTVLTTLVDRGVYPEPTYGLNNMAIPEWLNREDVWYRQEFEVPSAWQGKQLQLVFNGINYAGDIWLNGKNIGVTRGAFVRGKMDISSLVVPGQRNTLAVRVSPPPHPGIPHEESLAAGAGAPNGGALTLDGPTFFCTEGWDWIPGIRDRCTGLWQNVELHVSDRVSIGDLQVRTDLPLPSLETAKVFVTVPVENHAAAAETLTARIEFEGVKVEKPLALAASGKAELHFEPAEFAALTLSQPRLWWPNGYGSPELYHLTVTVLDAKGNVLDSKAVRFGVREVSYELSAYSPEGTLKRFDYAPTHDWTTEIVQKNHASLKKLGDLYAPTLTQAAAKSRSVTPIVEDGTAPFLVLRVNGKRIACRGGNWGLDEALKRVSREQMEPFFRLERDANLNMVRNWCGQNTEEVFYELADEYGLMVWNDFWVSTQDWNMQPLDIPLFLANADDTVTRFRNHPSIVLWCGRNEGVPPPAINEGLDEIIRKRDGTRYYQPSSVGLNLLWSGPWVHGDPRAFFNRYGQGFTTELGLPSVPTADAIRAMMPEEDRWPLSDVWAYHDWHQAHHGEVGGFMAALAAQYGEGKSLEDFTRKAQMINYVGHRALFEGMNAKLWSPATGRLIWMSHPTWGSTEWQLYSFDKDTHASYYGAKKACEPIHVQLNLDDHRILISNTTLEGVKGVVTAELLSVSGEVLSSQTLPAEAPADSSVALALLDESKATALPLVFVRLQWKGENGSTLADNFYWLAKRDEDHQLLNTLPRVALTAKVTHAPGCQIYTVVVRNPGKTVALMVKPVLKDAAGQRVLPAYFSDGYFSLVGGEERTVTVEVPAGASPATIILDGWNSRDEITLPKTL